MAGSWAVTNDANGVIGNRIDRNFIGPRKFVWTFTADAGDGSVPDQQIIPAGWSGHLLRVEVIMGVTPPTDALTDLTIVNNDSFDVLGGEGLDLTTSSDQAITPIGGGAYTPVPYVGGLTAKIANNAVNSATATIVVYVIMASF